MTAARHLRALAEAATLDRQADRVVPPSGHTVWLGWLTSAAMAFLAVLALALALATGRLADRWSAGLAEEATVRIAPPGGDAEVAAVLAILEETPGIVQTRLLAPEEVGALLAPWLGPDLPLDALPLPRLIAVVQDDTLDIAGLKLRLPAEVPGATFDDHGRWRASLVQTADRLRALGWTALALIAGLLAAMVTLAARASLAANRQVIRVLRLVGAQDAYVARAFTRRFTLRAASGSAVGAALGMAAVALLPAAEDAGGFLTGLGFRGAGWALPALIPAVAGGVAFLATRRAAFRVLAGFE